MKDMTRHIEADALHLLADLWSARRCDAPRGELTAHVNPGHADRLLDAIEQTADPYRDRDGHLNHVGFLLGFTRIRIVVDQPTPAEQVAAVLGEVTADEALRILGGAK